MEAPRNMTPPFLCGDLPALRRQRRTEGNRPQTAERIVRDSGFLRRSGLNHSAARTSTQTS